VLSAEARKVYEEGLLIPIMKLYEGGRLNAVLAALIRANTRVPDLVMGDFHAQIAGGSVGGERLLEFMEEFGLERLEPLADEIIGRTEHAMRDAIRRLRPGAYEYSLTSTASTSRSSSAAAVRSRVTHFGWTLRAPRRRVGAGSTW
jgi:N-methylhydantoinase B